MCDGIGHCLTGCGAAAEPGPHEIMVFADPNYSGKCKTFAVDNNEPHALVSDLVPYDLNDSISSLKVGAKARLHAFVDAFYSAIYDNPGGAYSLQNVEQYAYVPDPTCVKNGGPYDMGDNPIDLVSV